jgi:phosphate:Na+ symporter
MLLALHILLDTLSPAENAPSVRALLDAITGDPVLCVLVAAGLTWATHSSVATVLLIMSLAYSQFITPTAALALVLGANLGSAINPVVEGGHRDDPASGRKLAQSAHRGRAVYAFRPTNRRRFARCSA